MMPKPKYTKVFYAVVEYDTESTKLEAGTLEQFCLLPGFHGLFINKADAAEYADYLREQLKKTIALRTVEPQSNLN